MIEGKQTIAVDLDGTLAQYDRFEGVEVIGDPIPGAREFMRALCSKYYVMVHTCRVTARFAPGYTKEDLVNLVVNWLVKWDIPFHEVYADQGKPLASCFVDDRAIYLRPMESNPSHAYYVALEAIEDATDKIDKVGDGDYAKELLDSKVAESTSMSEKKELTRDQEAIRQLWFPDIDPNPANPCAVCPQFVDKQCTYDGDCIVLEPAK